MAIQGQGDGVDLNAMALEKALARATRTLVIGPYLTQHAGRAAGSDNTRGASARLEEAMGLACAIDLDVVASVGANLAQIRPATFLGTGKVEELAERIKADEINLVMMDCALSPVQQRNLEKAFATKVIDRTGLILEIFGQRARTREGAMQVELAHLNYQKSRLVRSWTHLERQRGGFGFLGGPGETQIETDRRLIQERMNRIERELEGVKKTRGLHRKQRSDVPWPVVALVGYTNAGKSTLFNKLTDADVMAKDLLFATLDPTLRALVLPHGNKAILSDTVGFISDLPTMLVSAFRATLEEVIAADIILHVRDISHEDSEAQSADVAKILTELGIDANDGNRMIEVWNKIDLVVDKGPQTNTKMFKKGSPSAKALAVSALTGEGLPQLLEAIEARLGRGRQQIEVTIAPADGQGLNWAYENAEVMARQTMEDGTIRLNLRVAPERLNRVEMRFGLAHAVAKPLARKRAAGVRPGPGP